jgi:CheY-like chemotaxis protein
VIKARIELSGALFSLWTTIKIRSMQFDCSSEFRRARVLAATTGRDGVDLVGRHHPKVIISDLSMPQMDGYEFLEHVRQLPTEEGGDAPIIALTGRSDAEERRKALEAGFALFLTKPLDPEELVYEICNVLRSD